MNKLVREALLSYKTNSGKIQVVPTRNIQPKRLVIAYTPGVAEPCLEITKDVNNVYKYTAKGI
jgi:malate dehydrogenase (oxaloacetate-decarboxylating)(NADP+)